MASICLLVRAVCMMCSLDVWLVCPRQLVSAGSAEQTIHHIPRRGPPRFPPFVCGILIMCVRLRGARAQKGSAVQVLRGALEAIARARSYRDLEKFVPQLRVSAVRVCNISSRLSAVSTSENGSTNQWLMGMKEESYRGE